MSTLEQLVLSWFLNAVWELPICFFCCWMFLRFVPNLSARVQYKLWLAVLVLGFLAPMGALLSLWGESKLISSDLLLALPTRLSSSTGVRLLLLVFVTPALYRAFLLLHGGVAANRLRRMAVPVDLHVLEVALPQALLANARRYQAKVFVAKTTTLELGPFTSGVRSPFILIPATLFAPTKRQLLVSVVAHELAHVQRRDMFWHLMSEALLVPIAFHPFSYLLRNRLGEAREMACDALVTEQGLPATDYARSLLDVAGSLKDSASPLHALGISEGATLERRIHALITFSSMRDLELSPWQKSCLILGASTLFFVLFSLGRTTFLWISAVPRPSTGIFHTPPSPPPPPPNRR